MTLKALNTRVIIKKHSPEKTTTSGIVLTGSTDGAETYAVIVSMGDAITQDIKVGDMVLPDWRAVVPVKYNDEQYMLIDERAILAVFEE
jgi:co-chaperonin GroES (HSP10)